MIASQWSAAVAAAVGPVATTGGTQCVGGRISWRRSRTGEVITGPASRRTLRSWIYLDVHLRGVDVPAGGIRCPYIAAAVESRRAERFPSRGWRVRERQSGKNLTVSRPDSPAGPVLSVPTAETSPENDDPEMVTLELPRVRPEALAGWTSVTSRAGPASGRPARIYLHLSGASALGAVLDELDASGVDMWTLKVGNRTGALARPDSCVVYLLPCALWSVVDAIQLRRTDGLAETTPGFSGEVAPGIAVGGCGGDRDRSSFGAEVADSAALAMLAGSSLPQALAPFATMLPRRPADVQVRASGRDR